MSYSSASQDTVVAPSHTSTLDLSSTDSVVENVLDDIMRDGDLHLIELEEETESSTAEPTAGLLALLLLYKLFVSCCTCLFSCCFVLHNEQNSHNRTLLVVKLLAPVTTDTGRQTVSFPPGGSCVAFF